MNDPHLNTVAALTLKSRLEESIKAHLRNDPLVPFPDFLSPTFEVDCIRNIQQAQRRAGNGALIQLFGLGQWIHVLGNPYQPTKKNHRVGAFLYDYYKDYPGALAYLEEVNPTTIEKTGKNVLKALITSKKQLRKEGWGPTFSTPGTMWQAASNLVDSPQYSPKFIPPPTPPRVNLEKEVEDLEPYFEEPSLLLYAPFSPELINPPRPLKRSRVSE